MQRGFTPVIILLILVGAFAAGLTFYVSRQPAKITQPQTQTEHTPQRTQIPHSFSFLQPLVTLLNPSPQSTPEPKHDDITQQQTSSPTPQPTRAPTPTPTFVPHTTSTPVPTPTNTTAATPNQPSSVTKKVLLLIYNPILASQNNQKLTAYKGWNDPDQLSGQFIASIKDVSGGYANYEIAQRIEINGIPQKSDGFSYTEQTYLACVASGGSQCHNPDLANYQQMIIDSNACEKRNRGEIDELWIWGAPWFGYWESNLTGQNAFWYNSSPTYGTTCSQLLPIMGFSYERGEPEMFEDMAHRTESTMQKVYGSWNANENHAWNKFSLLDRDKPGRGGCGNAHLAVNANAGAAYDRENTRSVQSTCDDFYNYPNLTGSTKTVSCSDWGCTTLGYLKWWFRHLPKLQGTTDGKLKNWWDYLLEPQKAT